MDQMAVDEQEPGVPFPGSYPDIAPDSATNRARWAVRRQASRLAEVVRDPTAQRVAISAVNRRRFSAVGPVLRSEVLKNRGRLGTVIASGEILLDRGSRHVQDAIAFLESQGMRVAPIEECDDLERRIVRLQSDLPGTEIDDLARVLRARGVIASVNHLTPLAPVGKSEGGAEPVDGPGCYPTPGLEQAGAGVRVAVIDTGITAQSRSDGWLESVPRIPSTSGRIPPPSWDPTNLDLLDVFPLGAPDGFLDFAAGHGTFVAGMVQQVAPAAEISMYQALDSDGQGTEIDTACAMIAAVEAGADIVNLSLGNQSRDNVPPVAMAAALDRIAELERDQGRRVLLVAAAGNYGDDIPCWPAAFRRVVSVAALGPDRRGADWSSRGWWVTCSAIGEGVRSTYVTGRESPAADPEPDVFCEDPWALWSGTSFAAPQVAGAVARIASETGLDVHRAVGLLLERGIPTPDFGRAMRILPGI